MEAEWRDFSKARYSVVLVMRLDSTSCTCTGAGAAGSPPALTVALLVPHPAAAIAERHTTSPKGAGFKFSGVIRKIEALCSESNRPRSRQFYVNRTESEMPKLASLDAARTNL